MAIDNLKSDLKALMNSIDHSALRNTSAKEDFHIVDITKANTAGAMANGTVRLLIKKGFTKAEIRKIDQLIGGYKNSYMTVINNYYAELTNGATVIPRGARKSILSPPSSAFPGTGAYILSGSTSSRIRFMTFNDKSGIPDYSLTGLTTRIRKEVWKRWVKFAGEATQQILKTKGVTGRYPGGQIGSRTQFAHSAGSTVGTMFLKEFRNQLDDRSILPEMEFLGIPNVYFNIAEHIRNNHNIDWSEVRSKTPKGNIKTKRIIRGTVGAPNFRGSEATDVTPLKKEMEQALNTYLIANTKAFGFDPDGALDYQTSTDLRTLITNDTIKKLKLPLTKKGTVDKRFKVVKDLIKVKQEKIASNRQANLSKKTNQPAKQKTRKVNSKLKAVVGAAVARKAAGEEVNLARIQMLINRSLANRIKKNMGRPGLINRTGRFAESAEVVAMRPSAGGTVAGYTYQLNPYETFENTGEKRWPAGYNPKPLIAKSIREEAARYLETKLTIRRV